MIEKKEFELISEYKPSGSQPQAIEKILKGFKQKDKQTLMGVTGSGKTFTVANIAAKLNKPVLVMAHNKTLAAQLYREFKELFPKNRVEYYVSFYDYYQPESYIPQRDIYIEKDSQINEQIEQMRLSATASILSRKDVLVVASVSAIYSAGNPNNYRNMAYEFKKGNTVQRDKLLAQLVSMQYERNDTELRPGRFRIKGEIIDFIPAYISNMVRLEFWGDEIERILILDKTSMKPVDEVDYYYLYPAKHFMVTENEIERAIKSILEEMDKRVEELPMLEAHRLKQRTLYDMDILKETGYCKGIENYSRHFDGRKAGEAPYCLLDYFPDDFLMIIDESHQTLPQVRGMYRGDRARKKNLIDYGFRLPSAFDNRPLMFEEFEKFMNKAKVLYVSATPGDYELKNSYQKVEQIIRPTGVLDPVVEIRPVINQVSDSLNEIKKVIKKGNRVLVTTLTKRLAEELSDFLSKKGVKTRYLHSEIETLERSEIIRQLRLGEFDVLVGINLLREGLDIPEVAFIAIMDADKEGFLRDARSLIQIIGRAARNINSKVILYADKMTDSIKKAVEETERRREIQLLYNKKHNIVPKALVKKIEDKKIEVKDVKHIPKNDIPNMIKSLSKEMNNASERLDFEYAILLRDRIKALKDSLIK